jgi:hypothetical protein
MNNTPDQPRATPIQAKRGHYLRHFLPIAFALVVMLFGAMFLAMSQMGQQIPDDLDTST